MFRDTAGIDFRDAMDCAANILKTAQTQLTEPVAQELVQQIRLADVQTSVGPRQVPTTVPTAYVRQGTGDRSLLLLHGFDSSVLEFRRLLPLLTADLTVWAVDLFGFGFTQRPPQAVFDPSQIKQHLYDFWQQFIQQPVILTGASMGGAAAIDFALTYPHAVKQLILIDSAGIKSGPILGRFLFPPLDRWAVEILRRPGVRRRISQTAYANPDRFVTDDAELCAALHLEMPHWQDALKSFTKSGGYPSLRSQLPRLEAQTLIIWGQQDQILGTTVAKTLQNAIAGSQLAWIPECGHVPHLEQPQMTAQTIASFKG